MLIEMNRYSIKMCLQNNLGEAAAGAASSTQSAVVASRPVQGQVGNPGLPWQERGSRNPAAGISCWLLISSSARSTVGKLPLNCF